MDVNFKVRILSGVFSVNTIVTVFGVKLKTIPKTVVVFLQAFLSASARSRRLNCPRVEADVAYFNSLQREAGDYTCTSRGDNSFISIHSSAMPETNIAFKLNRIYQISIHSSAMPETRLQYKTCLIRCISIHSSAMPETSFIAFLLSSI